MCLEKTSIVTVPVYKNIKKSDKNTRIQMQMCQTYFVKLLNNVVPKMCQLLYVSPIKQYRYV